MASVTHVGRTKWIWLEKVWSAPSGGIGVTALDDDANSVLDLAVPEKFSNKIETLYLIVMSSKYWLSHRFP